MTASQGWVQEGVGAAAGVRRSGLALFGAGSSCVQKDHIQKDQKDQTPNFHQFRVDKSASLSITEPPQDATLP